MTHSQRRRRLGKALLGVAAMSVFLPAAAQMWPGKPITLIVGFPAGGTTDVVARTIGNELSRRIGQPVVVERIASAAGVRMQHVGYKGSAPAMTDLLGGQVGVMYADSQTALPHVRSGKLRAIAVSSSNRQPELPSVPTMSEQGLSGLAAVPWGGMVAPPRTPKPLVERIAAEMKAVLETPEVVEKMRQAGVQPAYRNPADFGAFANAESAAWGKVIVDRGIKPE